MVKERKGLIGDILAALVNEWRVIREREDSKMVPRFSGGWEDGDSIRAPSKRGGWRGRWWVEFWDVRGALRRSGGDDGLATPGVSLKLRGEVTAAICCQQWVPLRP